MDNPSSESSLDANSAAAAFSSLFDSAEIEKEAPLTDEQAAEKLITEEQAEPEVEVSEEAGAEKIPVEIDGKVVELTKAEIAENYKNGLRQADYTRKTMEAAEARKTAEAESNAARKERADYANKLNVYANQLQGAVEAQSQINWQELLENDPVEYLKQERIFQQRHAEMTQIQQEQARVKQQEQAEVEQSQRSYRQQQQQELLAKLPEWKDAEKAKTESAAIKDYLQKQGFSDEKISTINDHLDVIMHRKAMMYDALLARAATATKKVAPLPAKVERPGVVGARPDGRTEAMKKLSRSGSVEDAARIFSGML